MIYRILFERRILLFIVIGFIGIACKTDKNIRTTSSSEMIPITKDVKIATFEINTNKQVHLQGKIAFQQHSVNLHNANDSSDIRIFEILLLDEPINVIGANGYYNFKNVKEIQLIQVASKTKVPLDKYKDKHVILKGFLFDGGTDGYILDVAMDVMSVKEVK